MQGLHLFFSPDGIRAEISENAPEQSELWLDRWNNDMYSAMYDYGMLTAEEESAVGRYVRTLVGRFLKKLTDIPELEMLRGKVKISLNEEDISYLLKALPFALGSEAVNKSWLENIFKGFNKVFKKK